MVLFIFILVGAQDGTFSWFWWALLLLRWLLLLLLLVLLLLLLIDERFNDRCVARGRRNDGFRHICLKFARCQIGGFQPSIRGHDDRFDALSSQSRQVDADITRPDVSILNGLSESRNNNLLKLWNICW